MLPTQPRSSAPPRSSTQARRTPPAGLPGPAQLSPLARRLLADAVRIARWAGELPSVDRRGDLHEADAHAAGLALALTVPAAAEAWERARLTGLIELRGSGAGPGWRLHAWEHDDEAVLRGWAALFDAWTLLVPVPDRALTSLAGLAVDHAPQLLSFLHLVDDPVPLAELRELLRRGLEEQWHGGVHPALGAPVPHAAWAVSAVRGDSALALTLTPGPAEVAGVLDWMLDGFAAVGALVRRPDCVGPDGEEAADGCAELTPLGHWAVRAKLEEICMVAQTAAGHIEQSALELLTACARYSPGPARAEYRAWLAARQTDRAVADLLAVARGEDALLRGLAFEALRVAGHPAEPAVRDCVDEPLLRPYALLWLAEQTDEGVLPSDVLGRDDAAWLWVDTGAAVLEHGDTAMLVRHVQGAADGDPGRLFALARRVGHPRAGQVLAAVASAHPDPGVARAARRSAFSVHDGGR
ncbi:hypothetical protein [Streptacidiphilus sp. P02-A3a]|uniref:hypothetical protein n=1 Tax=Streptacidiphilus sp. P02-A3a TaxID=2704468 RepID=UPI001CDD8356|nr:hypothetical protein [Streptacidiphilus sp. P02-A3a]